MSVNKALDDLPNAVPEIYMKLFKYKENDLFRGSTNWHLNACVGDNGGPWDYRDYAQGYFLSAKRLVDGLRDNPRLIDILIYPIAYNYRHAIELSLKDLSIRLPRLFGKGKIFEFTHKLFDNWKIIREYLSEDPDLSAEGELISNVEAIINDFVEIDPAGQVFRFPEDKAGNQHLKEYSVINVDVLGKALDNVGEIFEYWSVKADQLLSIREEYEHDI